MHLDVLRQPNSSVSSDKKSYTQGSAWIVFLTQSSRLECLLKLASCLTAIIRPMSLVKYAAYYCLKIDTHLITHINNIQRFYTERALRISGAWAP